MYFREFGAEITVQGPQPSVLAGLPLIVGLTSGRFVAIWQTANANPLGDIFARVHDSAGIPIESPIKIFEDCLTLAFPRDIGAIALPDGGFAISTVRADTLGANGQPVTSHIEMRLFGAEGNATTTPIVVGTGLNPRATQPDLAIAGDHVVVSWDNGLELNSKWYDLDGRADPRLPIMIESGRTDNNGRPVPYDTSSVSVAALTSNLIINVWNEARTDRGDIRANISNSDGVVGSSFLVNSATEGMQLRPYVSVLANGTVIVTWIDFTTATVTIHGQLLSGDGEKIGGEMVLADTGVSSANEFGITDENFNDYCLTALSGGGFALAWNTNIGTGVIVAQEFNSRGVALSDATQISNSAGFNPYLAPLASGGFAVAWSNADTRSVSAQIVADTRTVFDLAGAPVVSNFNASNGWSTQNDYPRHVSDINGDGFKDVIGFGQAGVFVSFGSANGSFGPATLMIREYGKTTGWSSDNLLHRTLADVNGDGRADVIGFGYPGTVVSLANDDGSFASPKVLVNDFGQTQGWTSQDVFARLTGDINGDGKADIVGFGTAGTFTVLANDAGSFQPLQFGLADFGVKQGWVSDDLYHRELADVNGDGMADIIGFGISGTWLAMSNGDGTFAASKLVIAEFGSTQGWSSQDGLTRLVGDVNGDGKADIVGFGYERAYVAYGHGDGTFDLPHPDVIGFSRAQGFTSNDLYHREFVDLNNDGQIDVVGFGIAGVFVGLSDASFLF